MITELAKAEYELNQLDSGQKYNLIRSVNDLVRLMKSNEFYLTPSDKRKFQLILPDLYPILDK